MIRRFTEEHGNVIPAQAGIQNAGRGLDSHFRGNDGQLEAFSDEVIISLFSVGKFGRSTPGWEEEGRRDCSNGMEIATKLGC